jgi:hypothetical protein
VAPVQQEQSTLRATLELVDGAIVSGDSLTYAVVNDGSAPLLFDSTCGIEWDTECGWIPLPGTSVAAGTVTVLEPSGRSEPQQCTTVDHLLSGHYRLTKRVLDAHELRPGSLTIRQEFSVRARP